MVSGFGSPMVLKRRDLKSDTMNFIGTPLRETHFSCSFARQYTSLFHLGFSTSPQTRLFTEHDRTIFSIGIHPKDQGWRRLGDLPAAFLKGAIP
jgi:hypothetical protein